MHKSMTQAVMLWFYYMYHIFITFTTWIRACLWGKDILSEDTAIITTPLKLMLYKSLESGTHS